MAEEMKPEQRISRLEQRCAEQDQKIAELQQRLSQMATSPTSPQSAHGEYLLSKGWIPQGLDDRGLEMWERPTQGQQMSLVEIEVPNIKPEKPGHKIKRAVVQAMELPCTTSQAVFKQRKLDERAQTQVA